MSEEIDKHDDKGNLAYHKDSAGCEYWWEYNDNGNMIHGKNSNGYEIWQEFDERHRVIYFKNCRNYEIWYKHNNFGKKIEITKQEFEEIKRIKAEKEFLSREPIPRFELIEL